MKGNVRVDQSISAILLLPFIKDLIDKCINLGFQVEDILETLRQFVELIVKAMVPKPDLRNIDYEKLIDQERFLERLIEIAGDREEIERANAAKQENSSSPTPSGELSPGSLKKSIGAEARNPALEDERNLRPIVVDASDVGFCESTQTFELSRIKAVVSYFEKRKHRIFALLPQWRKDQILASNRRTNSPLMGNSVSSSNSDLTEELERMVKKGILHYTPTRVPSKYKYQEDSAILELAKKKNAVIVSNDNYKKFSQDEKFKELIEERVLPYTIIEDEFLPSLSSLGNTLENFLRFEPLQDSKFNKKCPYMQKNRCTFGAKCKYWHPERIIAMGPNQGQSQVKTAHQKLLETVSEQKMQFQIILNNTIENPVMSSPRYKEDKLKSSSIPAAAAASNIYMEERKKTVGEARSNITASQLERLFDDLTVTSSQSNIVKSIIDNTIGETSGSSSWWSEPKSEPAASTTQPSIDVKSSDTDVRERLCLVFTPEQVDQIMKENPDERDYNTLMYLANEKFYD